MTQRELFGYTLEQLEALSNEELHKKFAPLLEIRPIPEYKKPKKINLEEVSGIEKKRGRKAVKMNAAQRMLEELKQMATAQGIQLSDDSVLPKGLK